LAAMRVVVMSSSGGFLFVRETARSQNGTHIRVQRYTPTPLWLCKILKTLGTVCKILSRSGLQVKSRCTRTYSSRRAHRRGKQFPEWARPCPSNHLRFQRTPPYKPLRGIGHTKPNLSAYRVSLRCQYYKGRSQPKLCKRLGCPTPSRRLLPRGWALGIEPSRNHGPILSPEGEKNGAPKSERVGHPL
jgi:hypothetical protein